MNSFDTVFSDINIVTGFAEHQNSQFLVNGVVFCQQDADYMFHLFTHRVLGVDYRLQLTVFGLLFRFFDQQPTICKSRSRRTGLFINPLNPAFFDLSACLSIDDESAINCVFRMLFFDALIWFATVKPSRNRLFECVAVSATSMAFSICLSATLLGVMSVKMPTISPRWVLYLLI